MPLKHDPIQVLVLTQDQCGFCEQAADLLQRLAHEYELVTSTLDIDSPEGRARALQAGMLFPPGILLDGEPFSYGRPSEKKLRRELDRRMGVRSAARVGGR
jgi:glutaredoxin